MATADVYDDCILATANGNKEAAIAATETILSFRPAPPGLSGEVFECFKFATGQDYGYAPRTGLIVTLDQQEIALKQIEAEDKIKEQKQAETKAAVDRKKQLEKKRAQDRADLQLRVQSRLIEACNNLYQRNPDETLVNKLCYDVFSVIGLPE